MARLDAATLATATVAQHLSDHNQLHTKANYVYDVIDYGATGDGSTDDSSAIQSAMTAATGGICFIPAGTYRANDLSLPASTILYADGVTIERHEATGNPVLTVAASCYVAGIAVSGRNTTLTGQSGEYGIYVTGDSTVLERVTSSLNYGHGIIADSDYWHINRCVSFSNGENPGSGGTGDGIFALNANYGSITNCRTYSNARTGIVATTYSGGGVDATLSTYVLCDGCYSASNSYNQANFEGVSYAKVLNLRLGTGDLLMSSSNDCVVENLAGSFYASGSARITVNGLELSTTDTASAFYLSGARPKVSNVRITGSGGSYSGNAFEVVDSTDYAGMVSDITVNYCNNGATLSGVSDISNLRVTNASNIPWWVTRAGGTGARTTDLIDATSNRLTVSASAAPTNGWWAVGDVCYDSGVSAGGTVGWVCTTAGSPGTWKAFGSVAS